MNKKRNKERRKEREKGKKRKHAYEEIQPKKGKRDTLGGNYVRDENNREREGREREIN